MDTRRDERSGRELTPLDWVMLIGTIILSIFLVYLLFTGQLVLTPEW